MADFSNRLTKTEEKPKVDPQKFMGSKSTKGSGASMEGVDPKNINEVSRTLVNINNTLKGIVEILDSQLKLDKKEKKEDDTDAARELDAKKKKGAENFLELDTKESKEQTKKTSKLAEGAKGILNRLFTALTAIFAGWLFDKGAKMMHFLKEGDTESFKKMGMEVVKALGVVAGIFALLNIGPIISAISAITGALSAAMPAIMALLMNPWAWAAIGLIAGIAGTVILTKTIVKAIQTRAAGGEEYLEGFNSLKQDLDEQGIEVTGRGKKEKFYVAGSRSTRKSKKKTIAEHGTPEQKEAVAKYVEKRDALIQIRDNMRAEMKAKEKEIRKNNKGRSGAKKSGPIIAKAKEEIRERYTKQIDALFSGELDISTIEGVSDDTKKDIESDDVGQAEKDLNTIDSATNTDGGGETVDTSKLLNKSTTYKEDGLESTGYTMTQADLDASKQKQSNAEKVKEISNNPGNEIEVIPAETGGSDNAQEGSMSMDSGEVSHLPPIKTSNDGNEYRMLFSHTYQQG